MSFQEGGKNNGEKSFVRIRIPTKETDKVGADDQVTDQYAEDGFVEIDQEDKAFAIKNKDNTILLLNQAAPRCFRNDIISHIKKLLGDYFDNNPDELKTLQTEANRSCETLEGDFIGNHSSRFDMPVFDFFLNAADYEWDCSKSHRPVRSEHPLYSMY